MDEPPIQRSRGAVTGAEFQFGTVISALLFLYFGFWNPFLVDASESLSQQYSVIAFNWMARIVGIGLLAVAGLSYLRLPFAAALDFFLAVLAAAGCLAAGAIWIFNGYSSTGFIVLVFGLWNASAARSSWIYWRKR